MRTLKQSTARTIMVFMTESSDHVSGKTGLGTALTITASKAGAAFASITPTVTERGSGWYSVALDTTMTNTLGDLALHITGTAADPTDLLLLVVAVDFADVVRQGLTALPNVASGSAGAIITSGTGTAQLSVTSGRANADVTAISADTGAADNLEAMFDGTGYVNGNAPATQTAATAIAAAIAALPTATQVRDAILGFTLRTGRTVRGHWRRMDALFFNRNTGLLGALVTGYQPDAATTEFTAVQDTTLGTRETAVVTNSEVP